ncbi:2-dehydropantoate 2-reductase [Cryptosporangium minutisporangium]|uniref:2-dehydropantoate 2-reductase n=1 Tax=Cryptosporangium minutisporangium TaxID=113569 RepID=A0ABP6TCD4_9ACTN
MRSVCIVGAGAVGGVLGARLAASGVRTSALARGATLHALRTHGWRLRDARSGEILTAPVTASDDPTELGQADLVVLAVKATALADAVRALPPLLAPHTTVLTAMNGVPWWFFAAGAGIPAELRGLRLRAVDPDGAIAATVPADRVLGGVVHYSASVVEPGYAVANAGRELIVGEPDGSRSERAIEVTGLLTAAGFAATLSERIQADVWYKLWGNMTMNPVSVLTGATSDLILDDPLVHAFCVAVMREAAQVGDRIGCHIDETPADRMVVTRKLGAMTTSMLQDARSGRPIELDALVGAVREIAAAVGVPTPSTDALHGLTRLTARTRGLHP